MKKLIWLLLLLPLAAVAQKQNFTVAGNFSTYTGADKVSVSYTKKGKKITIPGVVKNGSFEIKGFVDSIQTGLFMIQRPNQMGMAYMFWLQPGIIKAENVNNMVVFKGTELNDQSRELSKVKQNFDLVKDDKQRDALNKAATIKFIEQHPNSLLSLVELDYTLSRGVPDVSLVERLFGGLAVAVKNSPRGKDYQKKLIGWKKVNIGSFAPDFMQPDTSGKPVKLSDFKGKYVLLDFWASWCHPCRDEHPNLIRQYELYKNKNFTILSLSIDGGGFGQQNSWLKAIKDDGVGAWTHVCDLKGDKANLVRKLYGVGSIPENFLIGPDGKIIGKSLRGEELNNKLKELFEGNIQKVGSLANPADVKYVTIAGSPAAPPAATGQGIMAATIAGALKIDAKQYADQDILPLDSAIRKGKLANGFTYYIRKNKQPENRVFFYLANKVGSILENDNQQGLAHFMEHMNFNGTKHFPKNELVNYLQTAGVRFGADINAYTGFDETVYQLPLPSNKPDVVANGIEIMHDWAQGALLDTGEIDKERGVILEEERLHKGAGDRMQKKMLPVLLNGSRYAQRIPIGIDTVLKYFKPETIREFYHDWYRPDLQALIVVGDIDPDQMEKWVKEKFADLKNPPNERKRTAYQIPLTGKNQFVKITDPEQTTTIIQVGIKHQEPKLKTAADYKQYLIMELFNKMTGSRFGELGDSRNNPPFLNAGGGINSLLANLDQYSVSTVTKPGQLEKSFKAIWYTTEQIKRFGFTSTELERAKNAILQNRQTAATEKDKTYSGNLVNEYVQTFLKDIPASGVVTELQLSEQYLPLISLDDLLKFTGRYIRDTDRDIMVMGPQKDAASLPDERKVLQWMADVKNGAVLPYEDKFKEKPLLAQLPVAGKITGEKALPEIKAMEWTLSNGVKVIVKPTDFEADNVTMQATAPGGNAMFSDKQYPGLVNLPIIITTSGIGNYTFSEINQYLQGKNLNYGFGMDTYNSSFIGFSSKKYLEGMLQIMYLHFTNPRRDQQAFDGQIAALKASVKEIKDPEEVFNDTVSSVILNNNIRSKRLTLQQISQISLDDIFNAHKKQFGNAANFSFVFTGNIEPDTLKPLIEKYIASLPASNERLQANDLNMYPPAGKINKTVYKGLENKSEVSLSFSGKYVYNALNNRLLDAIKEIVQIRVINRLREQESGAYSPAILVNHVKIPEQRYRMRIGFGCAPANVEKLIAAALDEVNKLKENGPDDVEVEKFKAEDLSNRQISLKSNDYWANYLIEQTINKEDLNETNAYDDVMQKITTAQIKLAANKYLSGDNLIRLVLMPEKKGL